MITFQYDAPHMGGYKQTWTSMPQVVGCAVSRHQHHVLTSVPDFPACKINNYFINKTMKEYENGITGSCALKIRCLYERIYQNYRGKKATWIVHLVPFPCVS